MLWLAKVPRKSCWKCWTEKSHSAIDKFGLTTHIIIRIWRIRFYSKLIALVHSYLLHILKFRNLKNCLKLQLGAQNKLGFLNNVTPFSQIESDYIDHLETVVILKRRPFSNQIISHLALICFRCHETFLHASSVGLFIMNEACD